MMSPLERVLKRLPNYRTSGNGYRAQCPVHQGESDTSLAVREVGDGKILLYCHGHCETKDVLDALALEWSDLFPEEIRRNGHYRHRKRAKASQSKAKSDEEQNLVVNLAAHQICGLMYGPLPPALEVEALAPYGGLLETLWDVYTEQQTHEAVLQAFRRMRPQLEASAPAIIRAVEEYTAAIRAHHNKDIPWIDASNRDLPVIADEAWATLLAANNPPRLFVLGRRLARLERDKDLAPIVVDLTKERLRHELARVARWYIPSEDAPDGREIVLPPMWLVDDMLAQPEPPLPPLTRITEIPVFAPDGTLQTQPGYHQCGPKSTVSDRRHPMDLHPSALTHRGPPLARGAALVARRAEIDRIQSASFRTSGKEIVTWFG